MTRDEVLAELESLGTAQNRKVYARHGVAGDMHGVSYANIGKLHKRIKTDQTLAEQLWATGNHDARILATFIADPAAMKAKQLDDWVKDLSNYVLANAFAVLTAKTPFAVNKIEKWAKSKIEWVAQTAWDVLAILAGKDGDLEDDSLAEYLVRVERDIHGSANRVRHAMNQALISIGVRNASLQAAAMAAAGRIGKVEVDHGETSCQTPDAAAYIKKTVAYRAGKKKTKKSA